VKIPQFIVIQYSYKKTLYCKIVSENVNKNSCMPQLEAVKLIMSHKLVLIISFCWTITKFIFITPLPYNNFM